MRQHIDYNMWYDRAKLQQKCVSKTQYVAAMNPKAGSFTINPRLQRHFTTLAVSSASPEALTVIYSTLFDGNLNFQQFPKPILKISEALVRTAITMHTEIASTFLPTAIKFHYIFNLRDLSKVFQGMAFATPNVFKTPMQLVRLLMHEVCAAAREGKYRVCWVSHYLRVTPALLASLCCRGSILVRQSNCYMSRHLAHNSVTHPLCRWSECTRTNS